ncbi:hypothetical protein, partial [Cerasibacillus terrae]|uniref:hypothetical protein n=1 Tax=Cerasibacillus terrae TaxID=2498845 RepID=UPI001B357C6F
VLSLVSIISGSMRIDTLYYTRRALFYANLKFPQISSLQECSSNNDYRIWQDSDYLAFLHYYPMFIFLFGAIFNGIQSKKATALTTELRKML